MSVTKLYESWAVECHGSCGSAAGVHIVSRIDADDDLHCDNHCPAALMGRECRHRLEVAGGDATPADAAPRLQFVPRNVRREPYDPERHAPWATLDWSGIPDPPPFELDGYIVSTHRYFPITGEPPVTTYRVEGCVADNPGEAVRKARSNRDPDPMPVPLKWDTRLLPPMGDPA